MHVQRGLHYIYKLIRVSPWCVMGPGIPNRVTNDVAMLVESGGLRSRPLMFCVWPTNALIELADKSLQPETR